MRVVAFANNLVGLQIVKYLAGHEQTELVGLVTHNPDNARYRDDIIAASALAEEDVLDAPKLREPVGQNWLQEHEAQLGASLFFGHILRVDVLELFPNGIVNTHPAYLPWNRGTYPNVWSIVDQTPAGVTLHYMDEGVDTGDIITQRRVKIEPVDTGKTLYRKLEDACVDVFQNSWPLLLRGDVQPVEQDNEAGTHYRRKDVEGIDCIDLDETYRAGDLIDILRARTFPPHNGAYFEVDGRRVGLRLELEYLDDQDAVDTTQNQNDEKGDDAEYSD